MTTDQNISPSGNIVLKDVPNIRNRQIMQDIRKITPMAIQQMKFAAEKFRRSSVYDTCRYLFDWVKKNVKYLQDDANHQISQLPSKLMRSRAGDCKSIALFIYAVLNNLNISCAYRWANYEGGVAVNHVYVIAKDTNGDEIIIDPVYTSFNAEKPYNFKKDTDMRYQVIAGFTGNDQQPISSHNKYVNSNQGIGIVALAAAAAAGTANEIVKSTTGKSILDNIKSLFGGGSSNANNAALRRELDQFQIPIDFDIDKYGRDNPDVPAWANQQGLNSHDYVLKLIATHWFNFGQKEGRPYPYKDGYPKPKSSSGSGNSTFSGIDLKSPELLLGVALVGGYLLFKNH